MKRKPILGETLYDLNVGWRCGIGRPQVLTPVVVEHIGRKYFTCVPRGGDSRMNTRYLIDTWRQDISCQPDHKLYETEQEWLDEKEAALLTREIRKIFDVFGRSQIPVETLRAIASLLNIQPEKP